MWNEPIIVYKPVTYITREYTTGGWVEVEWTEYIPLVEYPEERGECEVYIEIAGPEIKCSECGSSNIAKTIRKFAMQSTWLVCLDCGHRGGEKKSPFAPYGEGGSNSIFNCRPSKEEITF